MVSDEVVESCLKKTHHQPNDYYGRVGRALCPYFPRLGVHVGRHLMGFRPCWSPSGFVIVHSPIASGSHVHIIRQSVWPAPLASPPSPDASGETDIRWVG